MGYDFFNEEYKKILDFMDFKSGCQESNRPDRDEIINGDDILNIKICIGQLQDNYIKIGESNMTEDLAWSIFLNNI